MADRTLNVVSICGSLRKGSYNRIVINELPGLAPESMQIREAPPYHEFPLYNADIQNSTGFPAAVNTLAEAIRAADGEIFVTAEYNFGIPGPLEERHRLALPPEGTAVCRKPIALQSAAPGPLRRRPRAVQHAKVMVFLDALTLNKPEIFIGNCAQRIDDKTGRITDAQTKELIKQQLAAFARFIAAHGGAR